MDLTAFAAMQQKRILVIHRATDGVWYFYQGKNKQEEVFGCFFEEMLIKTDFSCLDSRLLFNIH